MIAPFYGPKTAAIPLHLVSAHLVKAVTGKYVHF